VCCSPWGCKDSDTTELNWTEHPQMSLFWLGNIFFFFFFALSLNDCVSIIIKMDLCLGKGAACVGVYRITSDTIVENFQ